MVPQVAHGLPARPHMRHALGVVEVLAPLVDADLALGAVSSCGSYGLTLSLGSAVCGCVVCMAVCLFRSSIPRRFQRAAPRGVASTFDF